MVSISHVNKHPNLRIIVLSLIFPLFLLFLLTLLIKYCLLIKETNRYLNGDSDKPLGERYEKLLSFYTRILKLKSNSYSFASKKKIPKIQTIFIIDEDLNWDSISLLNYIVKEHHHLFPIFLLHSLVIKKKPNKFWGLIDTYYGSHSIEKALNTKRSLFIERESIDKEPRIAEIIQNSRISVTPVSSKKLIKKIYYAVGESIKTNKLGTSGKGALNEILDGSFSELEGELERWIREETKKRFNFSGLFKASF